jgi:hypothetical protein
MSLPSTGWQLLNRDPQMIEGDYAVLHNSPRPCHSGRPKALNTKAMQLMLIGSTTCAIIRIRPLASR